MISVSFQRPFISLKDATFRLGDRLVFEQISWTFKQHEQWALIGPNGSGKSILADALRGRLPLVGGELLYGFRPAPGLAPEDAIGHVAFEDRKSELHGAVVQSRWLSFEQDDSLLVRDFLSYERVMEINPFEVNPHHQRARRRFEQRRRRAIRFFQLGDFLGRTLLSLSNGERQRVQLAQAFCKPLRLLILDEPYTGLDSAAREHFHHLLEQLLETNLRLLLITTRVEDLPRHITHILSVDNCRVVLAGPRRKLMAGLGTDRGRGRERGGERGRGRADTRGRESESTADVKLLELRNVTVQYGARVILRNLNWTVHRGESWTLLGPNGSGKSTLLSLIQGDNPQAYVNDVVVFGRRRGTGESLWHLKQRIGWVSPELQLHFDDTISVLEAVLSGFHETIGVFETPTKAQSATARRWLKHFGLAQSAQVPLFSLSAGWQRVALLARALVKAPRLLLLDEPCQGLDSVHRDLIIQNIDGLVRSGRVTAIFVTHRLDEIPPSIKSVLRLSLDGSSTADHIPHR